MKIRISELRSIIKEIICEGVTADLNDRNVQSMSRAELNDKIKEIDRALKGGAEGHSRDVLIHWKNRLNKRLSISR